MNATGLFWHFEIYLSHRIQEHLCRLKVPVPMNAKQELLIVWNEIWIYGMGRGIGVCVSRSLEFEIIEMSKIHSVEKPEIWTMPRSCAMGIASESARFGRGTLIG